MILQFIFISTTYIILDGPPTILTTMRRLEIYNFGTTVSSFLSPMPNIPAIVMSCAALIILSNLKQKLQMLISRQANREVITPSIQQT
jgi:hypothetical protein